MIDKALNLLLSELNSYLGSIFQLASSDANKIVLTNITKDNGNIAIPLDSLGLSLVNIEEERVVKTQLATRINESNNTSSHVNPEIKLNLFTIMGKKK